MVQPNSCALTQKLSHGCFQAAARTVMRELYWKCRASDGSGESVKTQKKSHFKGFSAWRKAQQRRRRGKEVPHHQLHPRSSSYHSVPVPVIMRREWKHPLIRAVCCATHKLITGSKIERPMSALLSNFHTEALSRDGVSFVTSAMTSRSQSKAS